MDVIVVGPCGAGKSTLVDALSNQGYRARAVAQEHSAVSDLWQHGGRPAALIMLDAERSTIIRRRGGDFPEWLLEQQRERLASARAHADMVLHTDEAAPGEVAAQVVAYLQAAGIKPTTTCDT
jgi:adenylate kinase family enzyme